jgi:hypothetical protein
LVTSVDSMRLFFAGGPDASSSDDDDDDESFAVDDFGFFDPWSLSDDEGDEEDELDSEADVSFLMAVVGAFEDLDSCLEANCLDSSLSSLSDDDDEMVLESPFAIFALEFLLELELDDDDELDEL